MNIKWIEINADDKPFPGETILCGSRCIGIWDSTCFAYVEFGKWISCATGNVIDRPMHWARIPAPEGD